MSQTAIYSSDFVVAVITHHDFKPINHLMRRTNHDTLPAQEFHRSIVIHQTGYTARRGLQLVGMVWIDQEDGDTVKLRHLAVDCPGQNPEIVRQLILEVFWHRSGIQRVELSVDEYDVHRQIELSQWGFRAVPVANRSEIIFRWEC